MYPCSRSTSAFWWATLTNGQVASITSSPRARAAATTSGSTPCVRTMTVPLSTWFRSSIAAMPRRARRSTTEGLWISGPRV